MIMDVKRQGLYDRITECTEFWGYVDQLVNEHPAIVDRAKGSSHPRHPDLIYPLDYGYLEGTSSMDGDGIDLWIGSGGIQKPQAILLTIDLGKKDLEIKLILGCTEDEIQSILDFLNGNSMRAMLIKRDWDVRELLKHRRSIRRFTKQPVSREIMLKVLEAASWAPSSHNRQPWRFAVLTSQEAKSRLAIAMGKDFQRDLTGDGLTPDVIQVQVRRSHDRITEAPACIVLCLDPTVGDSYPDQKRNQAEYLMGVQSVAMAGQNLMLAASTFGLGSVWMCAPLFAPNTVREALNLPSEWMPQGMILLGYPAKEPLIRPRLPVHEITRFL
jgi:coenzyme F420-0:L-glutamate ligase / coenzyme F420-1:gamma-L-glutamate ligase